VAVTPAQEAAWGERAVHDFLAGRTQSEDANLSIRVDDLGQRIAAIGDRPGLSWRFLVITGKEYQAWSFPGGTICLTEALVRLQESDDELAFTLAHEISHVVLRHAIAKLRVEDIAAGRSSGDRAVLEAVQSRFDQDAEIEADRFGALYCVRANFRYTAAGESLQRIAQSGRGPSSDAAHPDFSLRIAELTRFRDELENWLEKFL
jgi:predicted Zn-dependent protease